MTTTLVYVVQLLTLVLAPLILVVWLAAFSARSWLFFAIKSLVVASYFGLIFFTGRWDIVSTWLRYVWPVLFVLAFLNGFFNCRGANPLPPLKPGRLLWLGTNVAILAFFTFLIWETRNAPRFEGTPVALKSPLEATRWYVVHGGGAATLNAHNRVRAQRYAVDFTGLNSLGLRADGLYPTDLEAYVVFNDPVSAPCDGTVVATENGLSDLLPPRTDRTNLAGNHVLLQCADVLVLLAHFKRGTVAVTPGDTVQAGAQLGLVGNSGNTSEPHLHLHAVRAGSTTADSLTAHVLFHGEPVPILFDSRFLIRNATGGARR